MLIGVLGATGPAGRGLAARLASVGHDVVAGSRDEGRSEAVVSELRDEWGPRVDTLSAGTNAAYYRCQGNRTKGTCPNRVSVREDVTRRCGGSTGLPSKSVMR